MSHSRALKVQSEDFVFIKYFLFKISTVLVQVLVVGYSCQQQYYGTQLTSMVGVVQYLVLVPGTWQGAVVEILVPGIGLVCRSAVQYRRIWQTTVCGMVDEKKWVDCCLVLISSSLLLLLVVVLQLPGSSIQRPTVLFIQRSILGLCASLFFYYYYYMNIITWYFLVQCRSGLSKNSFYGEEAMGRDLTLSRIVYCQRSGVIPSKKSDRDTTTTITTTGTTTTPTTTSTTTSYQSRGDYQQATLFQRTTTVVQSQYLTKLLSAVVVVNMTTTSSSYSSSTTRVVPPSTPGSSEYWQQPKACRQPTTTCFP